MERRVLGRTGLPVSVLGFGCGAVGGLMVRGEPAEQERAVARALEAGVNYFDTAALYGNGESERNLGRVLKALRPAGAIVGTKVRLAASQAGGIAGAVRASLESSLSRLGRDRVDILYLHNAVTSSGGGDALTLSRALQEVVPAFDALRREGKVRFLGFTAIGDTAALHQLVDSCAFDAAQIVCNLLNPSAGEALPAGSQAQDYGLLLERACAAGTGAVGIRILAGGALTGSADRHPVASPPPEPIGSAATYDADLAAAHRLMALVEEGHAGSLAEAATRYAAFHPAMGTALVGMASAAQLETALAAVAKGPLPATALLRLKALQRGLVGARH
ncbi:MAG: aldo/keto reductase [Alphaproteobacteria bacterium]|nr:aldo/keto reductase [Alphaproteobacteria bacterium]